MKQNVQFSTTLHMLMHMLHANGPVTSAALGHCASANPVVIRRTMAALRDRGIVTSSKGRGGGWLLVGDAAQISMRDIYECVAGGNMFSFGSRDTNSGCMLVGAVDTLLGETQREMEEIYLNRLAAISLADLANTIPPHTPKKVPTS